MSARTRLAQEAEGEHPPRLLVRELAQQRPGDEFLACGPGEPHDLSRAQPADALEEADSGADDAQSERGVRLRRATRVQENEQSGGGAVVTDAAAPRNVGEGARQPEAARSGQSKTPRRFLLTERSRSSWAAVNEHPHRR